ncbi:MAG TPA: chemotaxis protein CheW, partial [Firmicutes bacterium]|nr:chemotaxis protein CheW [Bacillota bacterium]
MELFLVVFTLNHEDFAVPIEQVREINRLVQITPLPKAPQSILGLINLRGRVIPVVSLRER